MILVALAVLAATSAGVFCERRLVRARALAGWILTVMLYVLLPFVSYVSFAHLSLSLGAGVGLALGYLGLGVAGFLGWLIGRRLGYDRTTVGSLIITTIIVNTGYFGDPVAFALLGSHGLVHAVTYDQVVSGPMLFTAGFAVGAAFGNRQQAPGVSQRLKAFLFRNPPLCGTVAGLLVPNSWAPHVLIGVSHAAVDAMLVTGFFTVGVFLSSERREDHASLLERPTRPVLIAMLLRFLVTPTLLGVAALVGVGIPGAFVLQAAMPAGVNGLTIGHAYGLDQRLIATIIVWTTLVVMVGGLVASFV